MPLNIVFYYLFLVKVYLFFYLSVITGELKGLSNETYIWYDLLCKGGGMLTEDICYGRRSADVGLATGLLANGGLATGGGLLICFKKYILVMK
jgi:hypothetical protein